MEDSDKLWDCLCCCGEDHTIRDGGSHINLIITRKLARWPYLAAVNFLIPESAKYPLANAIVCDRCLEEKQEIKYVMAGEPGDNGEVRYYRVPLNELEEPEFYWPDYHPDRKRQYIG
jgi:hypothetical protein